jgi:hypothetical protein
MPKKAVTQEEGILENVTPTTESVVEGVQDIEQAAEEVNEQEASEESTEQGESQVEDSAKLPEAKLQTEQKSNMPDKENDLEAARLAALEQMEAGAKIKVKDMMVRVKFAKDHEMTVGAGNQEMFKKGDIAKMEAHVANKLVNRLIAVIIS